MDRKSLLSELNLYQRRKLHAYYIELQDFIKEYEEELKRGSENLIDDLIWLVAFNRVNKPMSTFGSMEIVHDNHQPCIRWISNNEGVSVKGRPEHKLEDIELSIASALLMNENALYSYFLDWIKTHPLKKIPPGREDDAYFAYSNLASKFGIDKANILFIDDKFWKD